MHRKLFGEADESTCAANYTALPLTKVKGGPEVRLFLEGESAFARLFDAGESPKGRFRDEGILRGRQSAQKAGNPVMNERSGVKLRVAQSDASIAKQAAPFGALHGAAAEQAAELCFVHGRQPLQPRQKQ